MEEEEEDQKKENDIIGIDRILSSHSFGPMSLEALVLDVSPTKSHLPPPDEC